jgi:putative membrane protein
VKVQQRWLAAVAVACPLSAWGASYPGNTWLQVGPVIAFLTWWAFAGLKRWPLSNAAVAGICLFLLLHLFAARWTYSNVPYEAWGKAVGFDVDRAFGFQRNMFDRLVHFSFGLLLTWPFAEIVRRYGGLTPRGALICAVIIVLAVGALYEMFEWLLAVFMDPASAEAYNGQQGDPFDSQKDMAVAFLGSLGAAVFVRMRR